MIFNTANTFEMLPRTVILLAFLHKKPSGFPLPQACFFFIQVLALALLRFFLLQPVVALGLYCGLAYNRVSPAPGANEQYQEYSTVP